MSGDLGLRNMSPNNNPSDIDKLQPKKDLLRSFEKEQKETGCLFKRDLQSPNPHQAYAIGCAGTSMGGIHGTLLSRGAAPGLHDRSLNVAAFLCLWRRPIVERRKK
jgi:hypothetical protein